MCASSPHPPPPPPPRLQLWYATCVWDKLAPQETIVVASVAYDSSGIVLNLANSTTPEAADRRALAAQPPVAVLPLGAPTPTPSCTPLTTATTSDAADFFGYIVDLASRGYNIAIASFYTATDLLPADVMTSCPCKSGSSDGTKLCGYLSAYRSICQQIGLQPFQCEASVKVRAALAAAWLAQPPVVRPPNPRCRTQPPRAFARLSSPPPPPPRPSDLPTRPNPQAIGSLGVRDYAGNQKPDLYAAVQQARAAGTPDFLLAHTA